MKNVQDTEASTAGEELNPDWNIIQTPLLILFFACRQVPEGSTLARRIARQRFVEILDGGSGYETLLKLQERYYSKLSESEQYIDEAADACKMPELTREVPSLNLKENASSVTWWGPEKEEVAYRIFMTEPPLERGFRTILLTEEGLKEMPYEWNDPNDPAFFWLMQHAADLEAISFHSRTSAEWFQKLNVLNRVIEEFEKNLEVKGPYSWFDFDAVGPDDPGFLQKVKAIKKVMDERPELKDATSNAPIFRATVEEGFYMTTAAKPENTIRKDLNENFEDYFAPDKLPTNGMEWFHFFQAMDETSQAIKNDQQGQDAK